MSIENQRRVDSPYGARSTAGEIAASHDLKGRVALVTGGYSGIGLETVRALAGAGAKVLVPARDSAKAEAALAGLGQVETLALDLSDPASAAACAQAVRARTDVIDYLICNAGIMACPEQRTAQGRELQFATNHLGHFALANALSDLMTRPGARLVALSSVAHMIAPANLDDPDFVKTPYDKWQAYGRSKSANALFALGFNARHAARGVEAFSVHPGGIMTALQRDMDEAEMRAMGWIREDGSLHPVFKSVEEGAATTVWAALSPLLTGRGGAYCEDCNIAEPAQERGWSGVRPYAVDPDAAEGLWALSERLLNP
ncbi:SDR family NAD(P)-dependent oxidoreductase [Alkalicaulis satelles]|uniref:Probable oxidoreductase n=1 Tax=Alkalicaulis satelles TaxID=2609175 RepID=A0A5M6ZNV0_9PROT|nr:oxidoreductase [Alkalicaulis satelles]KAA5804908.1 SDR family NAD(P)-dependent oxidoreductase [Alkalicaulis satelles]